MINLANMNIVYFIGPNFVGPNRRNFQEVTKIWADEYFGPTIFCGRLILIVVLVLLIRTTLNT